MATILPETSAAPVEPVFYPSEDGEPMAETFIHVQAIVLLFEGLEDALVQQVETYIASNMFWYWEQGNPKARRAPDVMVIKGVGRRDRRSFFTWEENGAVPNVIFEITSEGTWKENLYEKRRLYEQLRVPEYFIFDPEAVYLKPALQGFRLREGRYDILEADDQGRLLCTELGLYLLAEGRMLRLIDAQTGKPVLTRKEEREHLKAEIARLEAKLPPHEANGGIAPE